VLLRDFIKVQIGEVPEEPFGVPVEEAADHH
jgi:hypothetical protein